MDASGVVPVAARGGVARGEAVSGLAGGGRGRGPAGARRLLCWRRFALGDMMDDDERVCVCFVFPVSLGVWLLGLGSGGPWEGDTARRRRDGTANVFGGSRGREWWGATACGGVHDGPWTLVGRQASGAGFAGPVLPRFANVYARGCWTLICKQGPAFCDYGSCIELLQIARSCA